MPSLSCRLPLLLAAISLLPAAPGFAQSTPPDGAVLYPEGAGRKKQITDPFRNRDFSQGATHWRLYGGEQHVKPGKEGKPEEYRYSRMATGGFTLRPEPEERAVVLQLAHPSEGVRMTFGQLSQTVQLNNYAGKRCRISIVAKPEKECFAVLYFAADEPKAHQRSLYKQVLFPIPADEPGYKKYFMNVLIPPGARAGIVGVRIEAGIYQGRTDSDGILHVREIEIEEAGSDALTVEPQVSKLP